MFTWWQEEKPQSQQPCWSLLSLPCEISPLLSQQRGQEGLQKEKAPPRRATASLGSISAERPSFLTCSRHNSNK